MTRNVIDIVEQLAEKEDTMEDQEFNFQHVNKFQDDEINGVRHEIAGVDNGKNIFDKISDDTKSYNDNKDEKKMIQTKKMSKTMENAVIITVNITMVKMTI